MRSPVPPPGQGTAGCTLRMGLVDDGSRGGTPGRIREGDPLEAPEPTSRWDHPAVVIGSIVAFWVGVLAIIFGALAVFG